MATFTQATLFVALVRQNNSIGSFVQVPDLISLLNGLCGAGAILSCLTYQLVPAALLLGLAGLFDYLDGKVARALGLASEFGKQLDSLCDLISFVLAPAIFAYSFSSTTSVWLILLLMAYIGAGLLRLARFNITGTLEDGKYFEGAPVPFSLVLIGVYFILPSTYLLVWLSLYGIHGLLMVSTVKIRKL
jgi:CDP-diacylglycerol--serine O-phosphatidyltransferase